MPRHTYKLTFFDKGGRAEPIRAIFHYLETPFEDTIISMEEWTAIKSDSPTGQMPVLEVDGGKLSMGQTTAICRHLAKSIDPELYFAGNTKKEAALCDMWAECFSDLLQASIFVKYITSKPEIILNMFKKTCTGVLSSANRNLAKGGEHLVGNKMHWCDVYAMTVLSIAEEYVGEPFLEEMEKQKHLIDFYLRMRTSPKMKSYVDEHWKETAVKLD